MDNRYYNIFRKLKEYFVSPGLNLWGRIRKRLFTSDFPHEQKINLKDFEIQPPQELFNQVMDTVQQTLIKNKFEVLSEHSIAAPEGNFEKITSLIKNKKSRIAIITRMPAYKKWIAAASIIAIVSCILWFVNRGKENEKNFVNNTGIFSTESAVSDTIYADTSQLNSGELKGRETLVNTTYRKSLRQKAEMSSIFIDGIQIPVENNEILYSLIKYTNGSEVNWKRMKNVIQISDYAGIAVSPYISNVINDLYRTKKNGAKTYKAKRAAAKIKRWRKSDIKTFDRRKNKNRNPLDIIDLGDNVY